MHIISYAQNFEDVMLWRALQHVGCGVYIDIGAQDPIIDSVSRAFYERGWRGVHVEPTAQYAELLRHDRPDEVVIQAAVSDRSGPMELYVIPNTGLSTGSKSIAENAGSHGYESTESMVAAVTIDEVFASIDSPEIHWLKIDVEGFERRVLEGWRDSPLRPWIIVVEATRPLTQVKTHAAWEPLLRAKGYTFVHFDGLNRYYLSPAHRELKQHFRHGPCIWDEYQLPQGSARTGLLNQQHNAAINQLRAEAEARVAQQSEAATRAQTNISGLNEMLSEVQRALDHTRAERDETAAILDQAYNELERTQAERDQERSFFGRVQEELHHTRAELDKTGAALDRAQNDLERDRSERREVQEMLDRGRAELDQTLAELSQTRRALDLARDSLDRTQAELDRVHAETQWLREAWLRERARLMAGLKKFSGTFWWRLSVPFRTRDAVLADLAGEIIARSDSGPDGVCPPLAGGAEELLNHAGEPFVRCAHATLLGRQPDPDGLRHYLELLRREASREAVAVDLSRSAEGRSFGAELSGLDRLVRRHHPTAPGSDRMVLLNGGDREKPKNVRTSDVGTDDGTGKDRIGCPTKNGTP